MKKKCLSILALSLCACTTVPTGGASAVPAPAQVIADVCLPLQSVMGALAVPGMIDPADAANIAAATPVVNAVCSEGAAVNIADLHALSANAIPTLLQLVRASPLSADDKQAATLAIVIAQAALAPVLAQAEPPAVAK